MKRLMLSGNVLGLLLGLFVIGIFTVAAEETSAQTSQGGKTTKVRPRWSCQAPRGVRMRIVPDYCKGKIGRTNRIKKRRRTRKPGGLDKILNKVNRINKKANKIINTGLKIKKTVNKGRCLLGLGGC